LKRFCISFFLLIALSVGLPFSCLADKTLTVLYSGDIFGNIVPTTFYSNKKSWGGLARIATLAEESREAEGEVLLLDSGNLFPIYAVGPKLIAEFSLKAMNEMEYTAMNLGWNDLGFGSYFLENFSRSLGFPFITSNLVHKENQAPFGKKYLIKTINGIRVGIVGVMPTEPTRHIPNTSFTERLMILPPEKALKTLIPELRTQADIILLLSQCGTDLTNWLVKQVDGIDVAITNRDTEASHKNENTGCNPELMNFQNEETSSDKNQRTPVFELAYGGIGLGYLKLTIDDKGQMTHQNKIVPIDSSIPSDQRIVEITGTDLYQKVAQVRKEREEKEQQKQKEAKELLKLSPAEYFERLMKEQQESGGKE
jgi:2',3'-cyclic-nucleotide 2'-phosphodiesterase (5'-nucleotidase family)